MAPLLLTGRVGSDWTHGELVATVVGLSLGAALTLLVYRLVRRVPWPRPFRLRFALLHLAAAPACGLVWLVLTNATTHLITGGVATDGATREWMVVVGAYVYAVVAGISYAVEATARAARAEAVAARTQLAALQSQIHPHFLFNALHTVVQLIPIDPQRAVEAAELVASLLRATLEDDRTEVTLGDEWDFVSQYLDLERLRFGDRLRVHAEVDPDLLGERVPSFALQTLVENAVRHGAAHRVEPTDITVTASGSGSDLTLAVRNTGDRLPPTHVANGAGTGLARLREQLAFLYGDAARLTSGAVADGGYQATVVIPRTRRSA